MNFRKLLFFYLFFSVIFTSTVFAQDTYVLPYPSEMPGSRFYKLHSLVEKASKYWYFGIFGQFKHSLKYSDKYLVEAKTLFEYNQFQLALEALIQSNIYFKQARFILGSGGDGRSLDEKKEILTNASLKHVEVLLMLRESLPKSIDWTEEKTRGKVLEIHQEIDQAISDRKLTE